MNRVRRILVPIDFSEDSANGLKYALSLAEKTQAEIFVLHVTERKDADHFLSFLAALEAWPMPNVSARMPIDRLVREKMLDLYHFVQEHVKNSGPVRITRRVVVGKKRKQILEFVKKERIDLVVLAFRRKSFLRYLIGRGELLTGVWRFPCPVLVKPPVPTWA